MIDCLHLRYSRQNDRCEWIYYQRFNSRLTRDKAIHPNERMSFMQISANILPDRWFSRIASIPGNKDEANLICRGLYIVDQVMDMYVPN